MKIRGIYIYENVYLTYQFHVNSIRSIRDENRYARRFKHLHEYSQSYSPLKSYLSGTTFDLFVILSRALKSTQNIR